MSKKILFIIMMIFISACSNNTKDDFNKPASFWYEAMIIAIKDNQLEKADNYFNSLQSEHIASPLIGDALLMLAQAHMENNEHLLSNFFINEYKTRFSNIKNKDFIELMTNATKYYAFNNYSKDQGFIDENIKDMQSFIILNSNNIYLPYIKHILTSFKLSLFEIDKDIIRIYKLQDKEVAQKKYEEDSKKLGVDEIEFIPSHIPWYVRIFNW